MLLFMTYNADNHTTINRFQSNQRTVNSLSKWIRSSIVHMPDSKTALSKLGQFISEREKIDAAAKRAAMPSLPELPRVALDVKPKIYSTVALHQHVEHTPVAVKSEQVKQEDEPLLSLPAPADPPLPETAGQSGPSLVELLEGDSSFHDDN